MPDPQLPIPLRSSADTDGEVQRVLSKLEKAGRNLKILQVLANSSASFRPFVLMSTALMYKAALPAADREVVILHLAALRNVDYEWEEHVPLSEEAGITELQRQTLRSGAVDDASLLSESQLLAVQLADDVLTGRPIRSETWSEARDRWGEEGALDLVLTVAFWGGYVPTVIEAIGLHSPLAGGGGDDNS